MLVSFCAVALATLDLSTVPVWAQEAANAIPWQSRQDSENGLIADPTGQLIGVAQPPLSPDAGLTVPYGPGCACGVCGPCDTNPADEGGISSDFDFEGRGLGGAGGLSIFGGVHGFRTPADLSHSGNFGLHEGLNYGHGLGDPWDYFGFQLGADDAQSNFTGDQAPGTPARMRNQVFLTGGLFHRAVGGGWQSGVTFDYLHDDYYPQADLKLIRSETSYVFDQWHEIGYWGAYAVGGGPVDITARLTTFLEPNDLFHVFYRRHFTGGGQGRIWLGVSGRSDLLFGGECTVPLGTDWALENNFGYLLPRQGLGAAGQDREVWAVSIQLVWYPGRASRSIFDDPWQPVLNVADNSVFMVNRR
jgi:hypothetical protein